MHRIRMQPNACKLRSGLKHPGQENRERTLSRGHNNSVGTVGLRSLPPTQSPTPPPCFRGLHSADLASL
jgi:hypothetical protein